MVQLTMHVKSSTLYGRTVVWSYGCTSKFFQLDGLLLFCIIMGLRKLCYDTSGSLILTQMSTFSVIGILLYKSIISGARYMGVVFRWS